MRDDIIAFLEQEIKDRCSRPSNHFGMGCFYHIKSVVKNGIELADYYGADQEVVIMAAWLHDVASVTDYSLHKEHHTHGTQIAESILSSKGCPFDKIEMVKDCIFHHRDCPLKEDASLELICLCDADVISYLDNIPSLFYTAYADKKYSMEEGIDFTVSKLQSCYKSLSPKSRDFYKNRLENALSVIRKSWE